MRNSLLYALAFLPLSLGTAAQESTIRSALDAFMDGMPAMSPTVIDFGDDSGEWANDGECDDLRFAGPAMAMSPSPHDVRRDASACRAALDAGLVSFSQVSPSAHIPADGGDVVWAGGGDEIFLEDGVTTPIAVPGSAPRAVSARGVELFFATNRAPKAGISRVTFTAARHPEVTLGRMTVSVPINHERGVVERPGVLDLIVYKLAEEEDPSRHFVITSLQVEEKSDFLASLATAAEGGKNFDDQALIYVHGFANSFEDGSYRLAQMVYDMEFDGVPILYSWPSMGALQDYVSDRDTSEASATRLASFMRTLLNETGLEKIHLICHSMGCNAAIRALDALEEIEPGDTYATVKGGVPAAIGEVLFAAPDVDGEIFANFAANLADMGVDMTLYASGKDKALLASQHLFFRYPRAGFIPPDGEPSLVPGLETIDITALALDWLSPEHSDFADEAVLMGDIGLLLRTGMRPPDDRFGYRTMRDANGRVFWRY